MTDEKKNKDQPLEIRWQSDGAGAAICGLVSIICLLTVIAQFIIAVLRCLSGIGPDFPVIGTAMAAAIVTTGLASELKYKRIKMEKQKITFSAHFIWSMLGKPSRKWNDIGALALQEDDGELEPSTENENRLMVFHFASGGTAHVPLKELNVQDLETLFRASKRWGSTAIMAPELIELRRKLVAGQNPKLAISLTTLWEQELQLHFATSTFVPLSTGTQVHQNRFRVIAQIQAGGLSAIYLARNSEGRKLILKELVLHKSDDASMQKAKELFTREAGFLVKLKHPQIARVHDHFIENNRDYLVLDYIPGQSLRQLVTRDGPQNEEKVLEWAHAIAGILLYLHGQEPAIIHRDLTPENLVLGEDNLIHLIDFGAANEYAATATGTLIGKQAYIAPEQFRGKAEPASDIYALGATLHFLLTGEDPEALSVSHPSQRRNTVSQQTDNFVASLTSIDLASRPRNCLEVISKISSLRATERGAIISLGNKK